MSKEKKMLVYTSKVVSLELKNVSLPDFKFTPPAPPLTTTPKDVKIVSK